MTMTITMTASKGHTGGKVLQLAALVALGGRRTRQVLQLSYLPVTRPLKPRRRRLSGAGEAVLARLDDAADRCAWLLYSR